MMLNCFCVFSCEEVCLKGYSTAISDAFYLNTHKQIVITIAKLNYAKFYFTVCVLVDIIIYYCYPKANNLNIAKHRRRMHIGQ